MPEFDKHAHRKRTMAEATQTRYRVEGMDCASCASKIDTAVRRMPGVTDVSVSVTAGTMTVKHDDVSDLTAIAKKVTGLGYSVSQIAGKPAPVAETKQACCGHDHGEHGHDHAGHDHAKPAAKDAVEGLHGHDHRPTNGPWWASKKGRLTILSGAALVIAYGVGHLVPSIASYAFIVAMLIGLVPIARRAIMAAMAGTPFSIEMLMTIAAIGAVFIGATKRPQPWSFCF
jgi:Zn2+/Cd2+-exporting ATPase